MKTSTESRRLLVFVFYNSMPKVDIGPITPNTSSMSDLQSSTRGMLIPRMDTSHSRWQ